MVKWWGHLKTINRHRKLVRQYCFKVGLYKQGLLHDLSKYSPTEFLSGAKYFSGTCSPHEGERKATGVSYAWLHHKGRNKHHLEYWIDYGPHDDAAMRGMEMPVKYVVEMFCDRVAACRVYQKENYADSHPYEYYVNSLPHYLIHPKTAALLESMLVMLRDQGEEATFAYIRHNILHNQ